MRPSPSGCGCLLSTQCLLEPSPTQPCPHEVANNKITYGEEYSTEFDVKGLSLKPNQLFPFKQVQADIKVKTPLETLKVLEFHRKLSFEPQQGSTPFKVSKKT